MKIYTLEEVQNKLIGEIGTPNRDRFEYELQMNLTGKAIKQTRQECNLTQEESGKLIGFHKARYHGLKVMPAMQHGNFNAGVCCFESKGNIKNRAAESQH